MPTLPRIQALPLDAPTVEQPPLEQLELRAMTVPGADEETVETSTQILPRPAPVSVSIPVEVDAEALAALESAWSTPTTLPIFVPPPPRAARKRGGWIGAAVALGAVAALASMALVVARPKPRAAVRMAAPAVSVALEALAVEDVDLPEVSPLPAASPATEAPRRLVRRVVLPRRIDD